MRNRRVQQSAGQLRADRVVDLEPPAGEHGLRRGRQPQQSRGRPAEQCGALAEDLHPAIHLDRESIG
jgi:hypothetical protein